MVAEGLFIGGARPDPGESAGGFLVLGGPRLAYFLAFFFAAPAGVALCFLDGAGHRAA